MESLAYALILGMLCAIFRSLHGRAKINRLTAILGISISTYFVHYATIDTNINSYYIYPIILGLTALGYSQGFARWGCVVTGVFTPEKKGSFLINPISDYFTKINVYLGGGIGMSLRWFLFYLPLCAFLAYITGKWCGASLILLLAGPIYYVFGRIYNGGQKAWDYGELVAGYNLGIALSLYKFL